MSAMQAQINGLATKEDLAELTVRVEALEVGTAKGFADIRQEMVDGFAEVRQEMATGFTRQDELKDSTLDALGDTFEVLENEVTKNRKLCDTRHKRKTRLTTAPVP